MNQKLDLRVKKTYRSLISAFEKLLDEKDFDKITVNELCEQALIRRPTFYKHFNDKYDYINFFIKEKILRVFDQVEQKTGKNVSKQEYFKTRFESLLDDDNHQYQLLLANTLDTHLFQQLEKSRNFGFEFVRQQLIHNMSLSDESDIQEHDYRLYALLNMTLNSCIYWLNNREIYAKEEMVELYSKQVNALLY